MCKSSSLVENNKREGIIPIIIYSREMLNDNVKSSQKKSQKRNPCVDTFLNKCESIHAEKKEGKKSN